MKIKIMTKLLGLMLLMTLGVRITHQFAPSFIPTMAKEMAYSSHYEESLSKAIIEDLGPMDSQLVVSRQKIRLVKKDISHKKKFGIDWGTTECTYVGEDNRVQYVVNINSIDIDSLNREEVTFYSAPPKLDLEMISIDPAPVNCTIGWARTRSRSGKNVEAKLRAGLKDSLIQKALADRNRYQTLARIDYENSVSKLFRKRGISKVNFVYRDDKKTISIYSPQIPIR